MIKSIITIGLVLLLVLFSFVLINDVPAIQADLSFPLLTQKELPNGAQGENPSGGYTCTGLDWIAPNGLYPNGAWASANDGRDTDVNTTFLASLVILNPAMDAILDEFDLSGTTFLNNNSAQGVAVADDGTYYIASSNGDRIIQIGTDGSKLWEMTAAGANGIAFDHQRHGFWWKNASSGTLHFYNLTTDAETDTMTVKATIDQLNMTRDGFLYGTYGANGTDAKIKFYDTATKTEIANTIGLSNWQAAEGVYYDPITKIIFGTNDGGFHMAATPAQNNGLRYDASSLSLGN